MNHIVYPFPSYFYLKIHSSILKCNPCMPHGMAGMVLSSPIIQEEIVQGSPLAHDSLSKPKASARYHEACDITKEWLRGDA
ncbi:hypothetical protein DYP60_04375 [Sphaerochaeta halotolerans]|jgi:hypothetical protein|uniref:Uncharacterized protein n=2 Tax=Sphaerochaeta halotolerans TaxID=2293840 RepID=A0A372MHN4_9SPIR|nr:hypothetical protein DYP60_04375 [Sphaerochaeta halotolerans]